MQFSRTRWAAIGAAVAVTLGAGGVGLVAATNPTNALTLVPISPCRLSDTRVDSNVGARNTPLGAQDTMIVAAHGANGQCAGIPATARGLSLNVTALNASEPTFLTIWPTNAERPAASSLNPVPGEPPTPNAVTTKIAPDGQFAVFNRAGRVDLIIDVNGYYLDHNHDDRYYTEPEVDAITALTPVAGGFVSANGTLGRAVGIDSSVYVPDPGGNTDHYEIRLTGRAYSSNEYVVLVTTNCPGGDASANEGPGGALWVYVERVGSDDTLGQCAFSFTVTPLPA